MSDRPVAHTTSIEIYSVDAGGVIVVIVGLVTVIGASQLILSPTLYVFPNSNLVPYSLTVQ